VILKTDKTAKFKRKTMNKMTVNAVESLVSYVINHYMIPRLERESLTEKDPSVLSHYDSLKEYLVSFSVKDSHALAEKTMAIVSKAFMNLAKEDLEDIVCNVITSTIQSENNEYDKVKKSTFGFWDNGYDLKQSNANFPKAFCHVVFKAVQSQTRNLETLRKHQIIGADMSSDPEYDYFDNIPACQTIEQTFCNMKKFEDKTAKIRASMMASRKLDEIDKKIFKIWFHQKNKIDFSEPVRMSSSVYPKLREELLKEGKSLSYGGMHYRWEMIRKVLLEIIKK